MPTVLVIRIADHLNGDGTVRRRKGGVVDVLVSNRRDGTHTGPMGGVKGSKLFLFIPCPWLQIDDAHAYKGTDPDDFSRSRAFVDWEALFDNDGERAAVRNPKLKSPTPRPIKVIPAILKKGPAYGIPRKPSDP